MIAPDAPTRLTLAELLDRAAARFSKARRIIAGMLEVTKPIISAINGDAMGLGASIALAADISIMSETARLGDTHVRAGQAALPCQRQARQEGAARVADRRRAPGRLNHAGRQPAALLGVAPPSAPEAAAIPASSLAWAGLLDTKK